MGPSEREIVLFAEDLVSHLMNKLVWRSTPYVSVNVAPIAEEYREYVYNGFNENVRRAVDILYDSLSCSIISRFNDIAEGQNISYKSLIEYAKNLWERYLSDGFDSVGFLRYCVVLTGLAARFYLRGCRKSADFIVSLIVNRFPKAESLTATWDILNSVARRFVKDKDEESKSSFFNDSKHDSGSKERDSEPRNRNPCKCFKGKLKGKSFNSVYKMREQVLKYHTIVCIRGSINTAPIYEDSTPTAGTSGTITPTAGTFETVTPTAATGARPKVKNYNQSRHQSNIPRILKIAPTAGISGTIAPTAATGARPKVRCYNQSRRQSNMSGILKIAPTTSSSEESDTGTKSSVSSSNTRKVKARESSASLKNQVNLLEHQTGDMLAILKIYDAMDKSEATLKNFRQAQLQSESIPFTDFQCILGTSRDEAYSNEINNSLEKSLRFESLFTRQGVLSLPGNEQWENPSASPADDLTVQSQRALDVNNELLMSSSNGGLILGIDSLDPMNRALEFPEMWFPARNFVELESPDYFIDSDLDSGHYLQIRGAIINFQVRSFFQNYERWGNLSARLEDKSDSQASCMQIPNMKDMSVKNELNSPVKDFEFASPLFSRFLCSPISLGSLDHFFPENTGQETAVTINPESNASLEGMKQSDDLGFLPRVNPSDQKIPSPEHRDHLDLFACGESLFRKIISDQSRDFELFPGEKPPTEKLSSECSEDLGLPTLEKPSAGRKSPEHSEQVEKPIVLETSSVSSAEFPELVWSDSSSECEPFPGPEE